MTHEDGKYIYSKIHRLASDDCLCKKVQVINQSDSLAEDVFGRTIDMVDRNYH